MVESVFGRDPMNVSLMPVSTGIRYEDEILRPHVQPFMNNHPDVDLFQNNARPHTARVCKGDLQNAGINVMDSPAVS